MTSVRIQNAMAKLDIKLSKKKNTLSILFFLLVLIFILFSLVIAKSAGVKKIDLVIRSVVYETEAGFVTTDKGAFKLPSASTEVTMESADFTLLITKLKSLVGKQSVVYIYNSTVIVGVSSKEEGFSFTPEYKKKQKKVYKTPPLKLTTTIQRWDADTYRLSIKTLSGTFCIFNDFEVSDYYNKVYRKLKEHYQIQTDINAKAIVFYHKIENSYECQGEIEDIEFLNE